jgi:superfamily II DNA or RNA helicase
MILRDYQRAASDAVFQEWKEVNSTLVVKPTGTGKTVLFADVIRRAKVNAFPRPVRAMVLAHREELIWQARDKIRRATGLECDVEMGNYKSESGLLGTAPVVVSTIQTQCAGGDGGGRMGKFNPMQFGVLIIDEAHHACAGSYRKVIEYYRSNPNLKVLGVTATPDRADEEALGQVFESVAFDYEILDAINDGWLVPIEQQMVNVEGLDFSSVRTTAGDLNGADLAAVLEGEKNLHNMAGPSLEIIGAKRALVFTASVRCAETISEIFNRHRSGMAAWVCGKTPKDERRRILADYNTGKIQVVCNCGVLTEGFDDPGVEVIIMGRPTKSRSLYSQMVGRATRPLPGIVDGPETREERRAAIEASGKPSCLVVDFVGNSGKHKLVTSADILGGKVSEEAIERAIAKVKKEGKSVRMSEVLEEEENLIKVERETRRLEEEARRARLTIKAKYSTQSVDPFDVFQIQPVKSRGWDSGKELSEKCKNILRQHLGVDPEAVEYGQGMQLVREQMRRWNEHLCTFKQAKWLKKHGYDSNIPFESASAIMSAWANNNWQRPSIPITTHATVTTNETPF